MAKKETHPSGQHGLLHAGQTTEGTLKVLQRFRLGSVVLFEKVFEQHDEVSIGHMGEVRGFGDKGELRGGGREGA